MNKRIKKFLSILLMVCMTIGMVPMTALADNPNDITSSFTDDNFKAAIRIKLEIGVDAPILNTAVAGITSLDVSEKNIYSLKGIENFINLSNLNCSDNFLTTLDITNLNSLQRLDCSQNNITTLNLTSLKGLQYLFCYINPLITLDVSGLTSLQTLNCSKSSLSTLNLTGITGLKELNCYSTPLTTLDVTSLSGLEKLICFENQLTMLNVNGLSELQELLCYTNQLSSLNLNGLTKLNTLKCFDNKLESIDVTGLNVLKTLLCYKNYMSSEANITGLNKTITTSFTFSPQKTIYATSITDFPKVATVGIPLALTATVVPADAANKNIIWSIDDANGTGASLNGNILNTTTPGTFSLKAKIENNPPTVQDIIWSLKIDVLPLSIPPTYPITIINGTADPGSASAGTTVEITANKIDDKIFKKWNVTSGGVTLINPNYSTTTFTMPANTVEIIALYLESYSIEVLSDGKGTASADVSSALEGYPVDLTVTPNPGYKFKGWEILSQNLTLTIYDRHFYMPEGNVKIKAIFEKIASEGPTGGGSNGGGSSSGGNNKDDKNDKPSTSPETKPVVTTDSNPITNNPTISSSDIKADDNGSYNISDTAISDAIKNAQELANKNGNVEDGIAIELNIVGASNDSDINMGLSESVIDQLIESGAKTLIIKQNGMALNLDLEVLKTIGGSKGNLNLNVSKMDPAKLSSEAKAAIGNRPVYEINIMTAGGDAITDLGGGKFTMDIPYLLGENENPENLFGIYVNENGMVEWLNDSNYDSKNQTLRFTTTHLSTYAIGYKENTALPSFSDIANHWAKDDIEFVVNKGLFNGVGKGKFAPNMSMTRGMFVTVLGKLAKADVSNYVTSTFTDVKTNAYYMGYVQWAVENNIVSGVGNGRFSPSQSMTREQMATIMANYAETMGLEMKISKEEKAFSDSSNISGYAKDAVKSMQMAGIISGKIGNKFDPQGTATRAEVSALLRRFIEGNE